MYGLSAAPLPKKLGLPLRMYHVIEELLKEERTRFEEMLRGYRKTQLQLGIGNRRHDFV